MHMETEALCRDWGRVSWNWLTFFLEITIFLSYSVINLLLSLLTGVIISYFFLLYSYTLSCFLTLLLCYRFFLNLFLSYSFPLSCFRILTLFFVSFSYPLLSFLLLNSLFTSCSYPLLLLLIPPFLPVFRFIFLPSFS